MNFEINNLKKPIVLLKDITKENPEIVLENIDVLLLGDLIYEKEMAEHFLEWINNVKKNKKRLQIYISDSKRIHSINLDLFHPLMSYHLISNNIYEDLGLRNVTVYKMKDI